MRSYSTGTVFVSMDISLTYKVGIQIGRVRDSIDPFRVFAIVIVPGPSVEVG
jgi:hypothetical protein